MRGCDAVAWGGVVRCAFAAGACDAEAEWVGEPFGGALDGAAARGVVAS
jgi:hypothetical protein